MCSYLGKPEKQGRRVVDTRHLSLRKKTYESGEVGTPEAPYRGAGKDADRFSLYTLLCYHLLSTSSSAVGVY